MFNRGAFNRGKFNTASKQLEISGVSALEIFTSLTARLLIHSSSLSADIELGSSGALTKSFHAPPIDVGIELNTTATSKMKLFSVAMVGMFELDVLAIGKLVVHAPAISGLIQLGASATGKRVYFSASNITSFQLGVRAVGSLVRYGSPVPAMMVLNSRGEGALTIKSSPLITSMNLNTVGVAAIFGYSTISLPGLVVPPGGELVIDTGKMTVTLNGEDVTRYFDAESEFFKLRPGDNLLIYEDGQRNSNILYKILWKDLWL